MELVRIQHPSEYQPVTTSAVSVEQYLSPIDVQPHLMPLFHACSPSELCFVSPDPYLESPKHSSIDFFCVLSIVYSVVIVPIRFPCRLSVQVRSFAFYALSCSVMASAALLTCIACGIDFLPDNGFEDPKYYNVPCGAGPVCDDGGCAALRFVLNSDGKWEVDQREHSAVLSTSDTEASQDVHLKEPQDVNDYDAQLSVGQQVDNLELNISTMEALVGLRAGCRHPADERYVRRLAVYKRDLVALQPESAPSDADAIAQHVGFGRGRLAGPSSLLLPPS